MSKHEEMVGNRISEAIGGEMAEEKEVPKKLSRKDFVKGAAAVAGAGALASCAPAATPVPEAAPTCPPAEECPPCPTPAAAGEAGEAVYEVFPPYGVPSVEILQPVPRLDTLDGKTICGFNAHAQWRFDETWPMIAELLQKKYPAAKFTSTLGDKLDATKYPKEQDFLDALPDLLKQYECDAVVVGNGC